MDVRARPVQLRGGIGALATRLPEVEFLPLAIEYAFWTEPRPEILISFGQATVPRRELPRTAAAWTGLFAEALRNTQDELADHSCRRNPRIGFCSIEEPRESGRSMTPGACFAPV